MEGIDKIAAALAKAQGVMQNPPRNREVEVEGQSQSGNKFKYKFKYATFDAILDAARKPLSDNGLSYTQTLANGDGKYRLVTTLMHESGQFLTSETPLLVQGNTSQAFGSALTYMKRYSLAAMLGIAADEDDDANAADGNSITGSKDRAPTTVKRGEKAAPTASSQRGSTVMGDGGPVPVGLTKDNKPDWGKWCTDITARINECTDVVQVNAVVEMHAPGMKNLEINNKKFFDALNDRIEVRRGNLAQKPAA